MRRWTRVLPILALGAAALGVAAPANAGTAPVLQFAASPSPAYGSVAVGQSLDQTFTLTNTGGTASAAIKVTLSPATVFTIPAGGDLCTAISLGPKKTCTVTVTYTPAAAGANDSATLTASAKKPALPATLGLTGSSPQTLSAGCQALNNTSSNGVVDAAFNAGEVITLRVTPFAFPRLLVVSAPDGTTIATIGASELNPAVYTIPATGQYSVRSTENSANNWSCVAG